MSDTDDFETWMLGVLAGKKSPADALSSCPAGLVGDSLPETKRLWTLEPHTRSWTAFGLPCVLRRGFGGIWCGYVGVPSTHPACGMNYDGVQVEVHWGLTYSGQGNQVPLSGEYYWLGFDCAHAGDLLPGDVDHPAEAEQSLRNSYARDPRMFDYFEQLLRKLGWSDVRPYIEVLVSSIGEGEYRDMSFAMAETNNLAKQLSDMV